MITTIVTVVGVAVSTYEVLSRVIPTSKTWSIIGNVLNIAKKISDGLDNKKTE